jgi:hypothetical protein
VQVKVEVDVDVQVLVLVLLDLALMTANFSLLQANHGSFCSANQML